MFRLLEVNLEVDSLDHTFELASVEDEEYELASVDFITGKSYQGPVTIIPSQHQQILNTTNTTLSSDIVIEPIPSNYGLITWNGSTLTVS